MLIHRLILEIDRCAARDSSRYQFNGVHFQRTSHLATGDDPGRGDRVTATSTDGKVLCGVSFQEHDARGLPDTGLSVDHADAVRERGFIVPSATIRKVSKAMPRNGFRPILDNFLIEETGADVGKINIGIVDDDLDATILKTKAIDGTYPDVASVLPKESEAAEMVQLNPARLIQAMETLIALSGRSKASWLKEDNKDKNRNSVRVTLNGPDRPVVTTYRNDEGHDIAILVMPMVKK